MITHYSDRSRSIDFQECPRSFWYGYVFPNGTPTAGLRMDKLNMDLTTGLGFHEGCNHLLTGVDVDEAVKRALYGHEKWAGYWPLVKSQGFILETNEDAAYVAYEQAAMVEALIRGWAIFGLPQILERFEIVEAERDEYGVFELPDYNEGPHMTNREGIKLIWGMRGDALLMDKNTLDLFILSLKTKKEWKGQKDEKKNRYDMQGMSETAVVEQRLRRWHNILENKEVMAKIIQEYGANPETPLVIEGESIPWWFIRRFSAGAGPTIMGVKMDFALKGRRSEYPVGSGKYSYSNPLIRPWKRDDGLKGDGYAFMFEFKDEMGGNHRLGKGWNRINIWEDMGVKKWIELLATEEFQGMSPMTAIQKQFVMPADYFRQEDEINNWKEQRLFEERRIAKGITECVPAIGTPMLEHKLNEHFPMYSNYPTDCTYCPFESPCHDGIKAYMHDPMSSGKYAPRTPNHKAETEVSR